MVQHLRFKIYGKYHLYRQNVNANFKRKFIQLNNNNNDIVVFFFDKQPNTPRCNFRNVFNPFKGMLFSIILLLPTFLLLCKKIAFASFLLQEDDYTLHISII